MICTHERPSLRAAVKQELDFIFVAKPVMHKHLYEEIEGLDKLGGVHSGQRSAWTGRNHRHYHYRWLNDVSLNAEKNSPVVSWVELKILDDKGKGHLSKLLGHQPPHQRTDGSGVGEGRPLPLEN